MGTKNITPPSDRSSIGKPDRVWASGIFNDGDFSDSLSILSSNNIDYGKILSSTPSNLSYSINPANTGPSIRDFAIETEIPRDISQLQNGSEYVGSDNITEVLRMTQTDYDNLNPKNPNTLYIVI